MSALRLAMNGGRPVGSLDQAELADAATTIGGENGGILLDIFKIIQATTPETRVADLLKTPEVGQLLQRATQVFDKSRGEAPSVLCRCPECGFAFETEA